VYIVCVCVYGLYLWSKGLEEGFVSVSVLFRPTRVWTNGLFRRPAVTEHTLAVSSAGFTSSSHRTAWNSPRSFFFFIFFFISRIRMTECDVRASGSRVCFSSSACSRRDFSSTSHWDQCEISLLLVFPPATSVNEHTDSLLRSRLVDEELVSLRRVDMCVFYALEWTLKHWLCVFFCLSGGAVHNYWP